MKKIKKSSELLWVIGTVLLAVGVALCGKSDLGVSMLAAPAFIVSEALSATTELINVGVAEYMIQGIVLIIMCLAIKHFDWRYLLAFVAAVIYGNLINLVFFVLRDVSPDSVAERWIMLIIGDCTTALAIACYFRTYVPQLVLDLFVVEVSKHKKLDINRFKWAYDISMLAFSVLLVCLLFGDVADFDWSSIGYKSFHNIGLATFITALINSPLIKLMGKLVDKLFEAEARFPELEKLLRRK